MQFSLSMFSDLLAEFQKYLSDRVSKAIYYTLGLVVVALGIIVGYVMGWSSLTDAWNGLDIFYKLVLSAVAGLIFLILAHILGGLQGIVERWFQGDLPLRLGERIGQLQRHRAIWQGREAAFQEMADLYSKINTALDDFTQWGQRQDSRLIVLQTKRALPRYHIITDQDLEAIAVDTVPARALQDIADTIGAMVQHPLDAGVTMMSEDVVHLPKELKNAMIIGIAVNTEVAPTGLVSGDRVVIYTQSHKRHRVGHLDASLVIAVQQMYREGTNETKVNLIHLTLAVPPDNIEQFMALSEAYEMRVVRLTSPSTATTTKSQNTTAGGTTLPQSPPSQDISHILDKINMLDQQYKAGKQWLQRLRAGSLEALDVHPYLITIDEAFTLIKQLGNTPNTSVPTKDLLDTWHEQVNDYRNKWIRLLQDAFSEVEYRIDQNYKAFFLYYPASIEKIAPTSIGNVFRALESYCDTLYGLDTVLVLPRLQVAMEQSTRDLLSKAHEQLALFEWLYLVCITIGVVGTILAFWSHHYFFAILLWLLTLPIPQIFLYPASLMAALDYAAILRLAFDRERGKVITMLGFSLPSSLDQQQEKALWKQIQQWWVYGTPPDNYTLTIESTSSEKKA